MANKTIEVIKCTIDWYVDDKKSSHKNPELISNIIEEKKKHFGCLSVMRGNKHTFLGINIEIKNNIIHINMVEHLRGCLTIFGEYFITPVSSPATKKLFEVREDAEKLSEKKGYIFHSAVEKIFFIIKSSRTDLETSVSFLTTAVFKKRCDWEKLQMVLIFVHCTLEEKKGFW